MDVDMEGQGRNEAPASRDGEDLTIAKESDATRDVNGRAPDSAPGLGVSIPETSADRSHSSYPSAPHKHSPAPLSETGHPAISPHRSPASPRSPRSSPLIPPASPLREFIALPALVARPPLATAPVNTDLSSAAQSGAVRSRSFISADSPGKLKLWRTDVDSPKEPEQVAAGPSGSPVPRPKEMVERLAEEMDVDATSGQQDRGPDEGEVDEDMEEEEEIDELESDHADISTSTLTATVPPRSATSASASASAGSSRPSRKRKTSSASRAPPTATISKGRAGHKGKAKAGAAAGQPGKKEEGDKENAVRGKGKAGPKGEGDKDKDKDKDKGDKGGSEDGRQADFAYEYVPISQRKEGRQNIGYEMIMRQQPVQARMCGVGEKSDRRPIDPPPIVQLIVNDPEAEETVEKGKRKRAKKQGMSFMHNPYYFLYATLVGPPTTPDEKHADAAQTSETELHFLDDGKTRYLTGTPVSSLYYVRDLDMRDAAFFCFPDLGVRKEGKYRLKMTLFEIVDQEVFYCATTYTDPFIVLSAKKFPGMSKPTELSRTIAEQGLKIRVRKDGKKRTSVPPPRNKRRSSITEQDDLYNPKRTRPGSGQSGTVSPYPPHGPYAHYPGPGHAHSMPPPPIPYQGSRSIVHPPPAATGVHYGHHSGRPVTHPSAGSSPRRNDFPAHMPTSYPLVRPRPYAPSIIKPEASPSPGPPLPPPPGRSDGIPFAGYPSSPGHADPVYTHDLRERQRQLIESQRREIDARAEMQARREREAKADAQQAATGPRTKERGHRHVQGEGYGDQTPTSATSAHLAMPHGRHHSSRHLDGPVLHSRDQSDRERYRDTGREREARSYESERDEYGRYPIEDGRQRYALGYDGGYPPQPPHTQSRAHHSSYPPHDPYSHRTGHPDEAYRAHYRRQHEYHQYPSHQHHQTQHYQEPQPPHRAPMSQAHPDPYPRQHRQPQQQQQQQYSDPGQQHPHQRHTTSGSTSMSSRSTPQPLRTPHETPTMSHQLLHPPASRPHVQEHLSSPHKPLYSHDRERERDREHDWRSDSRSPVPARSDHIGLGIDFKDKPLPVPRSEGFSLPPISSLTSTPSGERRGGRSPDTPHASLGPTPGRDRRLGLGHLVD